MAIDTAGTFVQAFGAQLPLANSTIDSALQQLCQIAVQADPSTTADALKNARGKWFGWMMAIAAWNARAVSGKSGIAAPLPNVSGFDCGKLYQQPLYDMIVNLRNEVMLHNVRLITSNPDFVLLDPKQIPLPTLPPAITAIPSATALNELDNLYSRFINACAFDDLVGYVAVKSSFRPDRRLQVPHEGSLMKALYAHLQTRLWVTQPKGLKYYAMTVRATTPDRTALMTIATHSIPNVNSIPMRAVDEVFEVPTFADAEAAFVQILPP